MAGIDSTLKSIGGYLKSIVDVGFSLAVVFLVVDVLFGQTTGIVDNVSALVTSFTGNGIVGLIALIFFLTIYQD